MANIDFVLDDFDPLAIGQKIAKRFRKRRLFLNISQQALANKSGVSLGSIKRFELTGEVSLKHLLKLALILDSIDEFHNLFPENNYQTVDDILKSRKIKERKRGRNV